jgi:hypothetical protein
MAEAEAHAAALKAFQDAMGHTDEGQNQYASSSYPTYHAAAAIYGVEKTDKRYSSGSFIEADEMRLMESLQLSRFDSEHSDLFQGLIGFDPSQPPSDDNAAHELLRMLEQQQLRQEYMASTATVEEPNPRRPERHFLTIAQNGTFSYLWKLFIGCKICFPFPFVC